ncbi:MAG: hypothetical protein ACRECP_02575 [Methylocella sp.]
MKKLVFGLFPFPWRLSLIGTWIVVTTLYVLAALLLQSPLPSSLVTGIGLFVPISFLTVFAVDGCLQTPLNWHSWSYYLANVWCVVPLLTLIVILGADWVMHIIGIPRTSVKLLFNFTFLILLTFLVNMALFGEWVPYISL